MGSIRNSGTAVSYLWASSWTPAQQFLTCGQNHALQHSSFLPVGRIMNSCMASLLPAWLPPLMTLKAGTGSTSRLLPARSARCWYRGTPCHQRKTKQSRTALIKSYFVSSWNIHTLSTAQVTSTCRSNSKAQLNLLSHHCLQMLSRWQAR